MFLSDENADNGNPNDAACLSIWPISDCIFCNKKLTSKSEFKRSKLLQCLHAICYNCFLNWDEKVDKQCSVCSFYSKKKDVTENKVLAEMVTDEDELSNEDVCTIHNVPVTHWCIDCAELICEDCVNHHGQLKSTQNHKIMTHKEYLHDKSSSQRSIFPCVAHPQNDLSIVCHTCKIMTCRDCQLEMHKDHKYDFISDSVTNTKTELFDIYKKVEYSSVVLNSALKKISEREEKLEIIKKSLVLDIKKEFDLIQELLRKRCESLMLEAIDKANKKLEDCEINRRVIEKNLELLRHCLKFVKLVLYSSSDAVLFYTKDLILNHLKRISITQSIPSSADVIHLKFSTENIDEAKKKIENCGAIHESEDLASVDRKYLFAVYSALMSVYKAKTDDSKQKKDKHGLSDFSQSTSSPTTEKTLPFASVSQQGNDCSAVKKSALLQDTCKLMKPEEMQQQQIVPQLWHIPETMPIPTNAVMPGDPAQIGNNIKKVRLQLHTGNNPPPNPQSLDNSSPLSSSDDVEIIDEIMCVLNEMEKREGTLPGIARLPEQVSPPDFQNESWCSVCLKGGDVVCCNNCPKVFHVGCHIPQIKLPSKDCLFPVKNIGWRCLLCQDIEPLKLDSGVSYRGKLQKELKIASRLLLELYCQVEASTPFRVPLQNKAANRSICLGDIKNHLTSGKYLNIMSFVKDVRYMFACCFHYEQQDYMKIAHSRSLEEMFNRLLSQFVPCTK